MSSQLEASDYYEFFRIQKEAVDLTDAEDSSASQEVIGWWKKYQITRALNHARYSIATPEELHLLKSHDIPLPNTAHARTLQHKRNLHV